VYITLLNYYSSSTIVYLRTIVYTVMSISKQNLVYDIKIC
jgi:hypothetical protein